MTKKRIHFPRTTAQRRQLLFETWEASGDVEEACRKAHVCRQTFYNWKPRFEAGGYAALAEFASHAPKEPYRISPAIEERVIGMRREHPDWGKRRIADELAKGNAWVPLVSPNTVKRILHEVGLWSEPETPAQKGGSTP
jgi:transposase